MWIVPLSAAVVGLGATQPIHHDFLHETEQGGTTSELVAAISSERAGVTERKG